MRGKRNSLAVRKEIIMRLAIIQNLYDNYIVDFQSKNFSTLKDYKSSLSLLQYDSFSWNGCWAEHLKDYGIEVVELYVNFDMLNAYWCLENNLKQNSGILDIIIQQLKVYKVDAVLNTDVNILKSPFIRRIKEETNVKHVYAHVCSPYYLRDDVSEYDGLFTCLHRLVEMFKSYGKPAVYLPHCFNSNIIERIEVKKSREKNNKIIFAGGVIKGGEWHDDRERLLLSFIHNRIPMTLLSEITNYNYVKGYATSIGKKSIFYLLKMLREAGVRDQILHKMPLIRKALPWKSVPDNSVNRTLFNFSNKPIYGLEYFSVMGNHALALNNHGGASRDEAANMRLFESTGVGAALITDHKSNLREFFDIDREVVSYKTIPEAMEKAVYLLDHPAVSDQIGKAGQKRVLKDHTFKNRAPLLASSILRNFR